MKPGVILLLLCTFFMTQAQTLQYPVTRKTDQQDNYHGTLVKDPYRWLEADTAEEVKAWVEAQNKVTFDYLSKLPGREKFKNRLSEILNYERYSAPSRAGEYYFFSKNDGLQNQSVIYYQKGLTGTPKVFLDPNTLSKDGTAAVSILGYSNDHKYVAYAINQSGSDWQTIKVRRIEDAADMTDQLDWVKFSGASWFKDGFFYSRYPTPEKGTEFSGKNEFHQVWYHKMGTPQAQDQLIFEDKTEPLRYYGTGVTEDEHYLFVYVSQGTYGTEIFWKDLTKPDSKLQPCQYQPRSDE
jgi:prolyl oligopeptidase